MALNLPQIFGDATRTGLAIADQARQRVEQLERERFIERSFGIQNLQKALALGIQRDNAETAARNSEIGAERNELIQSRLLLDEQKLNPPEGTLAHREKVAEIEASEALTEGRNASNALIGEPVKINEGLWGAPARSTKAPSTGTAAESIIPEGAMDIPKADSIQTEIINTDETIRTLQDQISGLKSKVTEARGKKQDTSELEALILKKEQEKVALETRSNVLGAEFRKAKESQDADAANLEASRKKEEEELKRVATEKEEIVVLRESLAAMKVRYDAEKAAAAVKPNNPLLERKSGDESPPPKVDGALTERWETERAKLKRLTGDDVGPIDGEGVPTPNTRSFFPLKGKPSRFKEFIQKKNPKISR